MPAPRLGPMLTPGQAYTIPFTFTRSSTDATAWSPASVTLTLKDPAGTTTNPTANLVANVATVTLTLTVTGVHTLRVVGAAGGGFGPSASEWTLYCDSSAVS